MDLTKIMNPLTCPTCESIKVWNLRGTYGTQFECENDHQWDVADGKRNPLGGAINLGAGRWRIWTEDRPGPVDMDIHGPIMIEAIRLNLTKFYDTDQVKIVAGQRLW